MGREAEGEGERKRERERENLFLKKDFIYLFTKDIQERGRDIGRGRSRLCAGSPMWNSIPGPGDHALSQRQVLNH